MIIGGGSRRCAKWWATHLMRTDAGQSVRFAEVRGLAGNDIPFWFRQMEAVSFGTRAANYAYHAHIDPPEDERLTEAQWNIAIDTLEHNLGLDGHSRFVIEHEKDGRTHRHVFWSRIDPDTMTAVSDSKTYRIHERTADALEKEFGHEPTPRGRGPEGRNPKNYEVRRGRDTGIDPKEVAAVLKELWYQADTGRAFAAALEEHGLILARGDRRDFVVIDQAGDDHSLSRRLGGAKKGEIAARMADIDRASLPSVEEARALAREHAAGPKEREDAQPEPAPLPADASPKQHRPSPFGELAQELLHAAREGFAREDPPTAELPELARDAVQPEATGFEKLARDLARGAREAAPVAAEMALAAAIVEGEHVAQGLLRPKQEAEQELSPFDRLARGTKQALRDATGDDDRIMTSALDWLAEKLGHGQSGAPTGSPEATPFERMTEETKQALRENGGQPYTGHEPGFWRRSVEILTAARDQLLGFVKETWAELVGRRRGDPDPDRDDPGFER